MMTTEELDREFLYHPSKCPHSMCEEAPGGSWCEDCGTFFQYDDDELFGDDFGCCFGKDCQMVGIHMMSDCHTIGDLEAEPKQAALWGE